MDNPVERAQAILGWMDPEELTWLHEVAKRMGSIVELGCHRGRSTYVLCAGCPGQVYAIDCHWCGTMHPFEGREVHTYPEFMANVGHFSNLTALEMNFVDAAVSDLIPPEVDMVFIDGDHAYESVLLDLETWDSRAMKLICGHDLSPVTPGVERALNEFFGAGKVARGPGSLWYFEK
jgi:hypothetical protein